MKTEAFTFPGHDGNDLAARLDLPDGPVRATALFAHCFTCTKDILPARRIARRLAAAGVAVLRFDFTGLGDSEGDHAQTSFTSRVSDLTAACKALSAKGFPPRLLIGHSLGGAAVLKAAGMLDEVRAVVTIGSPFSPDHVANNFAARVEEIVRDGVASVDLGGKFVNISKGFLDDIQAQDLTRAIHGMKAALLVMHAPRDEVVGIDNATEIFRTALHPKSFITLDDADHLISREEDAEYIAGIIAAWSGRYLGFDLAPGAPEPVNEMPVPASPAPRGAVRVTELDPEGYLQDVANGPDHWFFSDEPEKVGGTNKGPNPYALLKAALGSCSSMTMRMYARVKKWPVEGISVMVTHEKVPAGEGVKDDRGRPLKIDVFTREITLTGPLDDTQRARLVEIADRCPVHRTLHQSSEIHTKLIE